MKKNFINISCKEATQLILKKEEGKLSIGQRVQLSLHLLICDLCKSFNLQNKWINKHIHHLQEHFSIKASEEFKQKVLTSFSEENN